MKRAHYLMISGFFLLSLTGFGFSSAKATQNNWEYVYCIGGDAIDHADLSVESKTKEDIVHLTLVTGASDDEKENLTRTYTAHLGKGSFRKMFEAGKLDIVMNSDKHPESAFGGETSFAALVDLARGKDGDLHGYIALDGSVFQLDCPRDPQKYFETKS